MRLVATALLVVPLLASSVRGQSGPPASDSLSRMPRWLVGAGADIGQPIGAFRDQVKNAAGAQAHALLRLDRRGRTAIRFQAGWLNYGHESQRTCLGNTTGCRVAVDVTTANGILTFGVGPQVTYPLGPLRTYGYALVGASRFATVSGLGGGILPDIVAADEHFGDGGLAVSSGVGLQLPVRAHTTLDVGVAYQVNGRRNYLVKGGVTDNPDGSLAFDVKRSRADLFAIRLGVTTAMKWGRRTSGS